MKYEVTLKGYVDKKFENWSNSQLVDESKKWSDVLSVNKLKSEMTPRSVDKSIKKAINQLKIEH